jgi:predicted  nucleic acid-binding Zn-ribbon protein
MNIKIFAALLMAGFASLAQAQDAVTTRELNQMLSRYDATIARLEQQNERLMSEFRALQREQERVTKLVESQQGQIQQGIDGLQEFRNTEIESIKASFWGSGKRDCKDLGVKHQQIKVTLSPDNTESVRFLCFDGKPLLLGAEQYVVGR